MDKNNNPPPADKPKKMSEQEQKALIMQQYWGRKPENKISGHEDMIENVKKALELLDTFKSASQSNHDIVVKVYSKDQDIEIPSYKTDGSAGADIRACIPENEPIELQPFQRMKIPTGLFMEIPLGFEAAIEPRSGLSLNDGIVAIHGTIDSDYREEIGVIIINLSNECKFIHRGDRIAQFVFRKVERAKFLTVSEVEQLSKTDRNGGFGSTGIK